MKQKKILLTVLLLLILTAVVACSSAKPSSKSTETSSESGKTSSESVSSEGSTDSSTSSGSTVTPSGSTETPSGSTETPSGSTETPSGSSSEIPPEENVITVKEAIDIANSLAEGEVTAERYYIRATIVDITNPNYGAMNISDETGEIYVYGSYSADGSVGYSSMTEKPYKGAEIYISTLIQNYKGTPELKSVWIKEFKEANIDVDESKYTEMTVAEARTAAKDTFIKVSGVVAQITYANGKIPNGFILVDDTNAIYVFDDQVAGRVTVGNTVTVLAEKTWWILEKEQENATKFGYVGCCQLQNAVLKSNDNKTSDFNTSWISETTVKNIMETPVSEDITTTIFKVNALVKKAAGSGFVNYYFDDLDGTTGSYTYTQCNGSDFGWLDAFDGKICTVYLTALNAKSTGTGCVWRFLPVKVIDEGFTFDPANAGKFAVEYYALAQFTDSYAADPAKELITTVSSELLGLDNIQISYTSNNTKVAYIENGVLHTGSTGKAIITITASYKDFAPYTATVEITVGDLSNYTAITVAEAINSPVSTADTITVKGVVGPSLVNQAGGFYLIDETGVIAVKFATADDIKNISLGDEIIITGNRDAYSAKNGYPGQVCITGAVLEVNLYGANEYSTASFDSSKTFADVYALTQDVNTDYTTKVFVTEVKITSTVTTFSTNYYLVNPNNEEERITLYSASGAQYGWLGQFVGQTVKIEFALCNWNAKTPYKACVLAVYTENGEKVVNQLNFG